MEREESVLKLDTSKGWNKMRKKQTTAKVIGMVMIVMMLFVVACGKKQGDITETSGTESVSSQFDTHMEELFRSEIVLNTINLHYTLAYPENFGITEYEPSLGSFNLEELQNSYKEMRELQTELLSYPLEELTKEQQFTYQIVMDYIETELLAEDLLLYTEVLSPVSGYQAQLPVLLAEYTFRIEQDIQDYLALLSLVDDIFAQLIELEQAKSEAGLFMPDFAVEDIIDQCKQFIAFPEENYMLDVFETKLQEFEGLTKEQKDAYLVQHEELITTEIVGAYQDLIDSLEALKGTGTNDKGLYYYEDGIRYYEYLVRSLTGSEREIEELMEETFSFIYNSITQMQEIMIKDKEVINRFSDYEFCETEPERILEDLLVKIEKDFPKLPETSYTIKSVHSSMEEYMSPAFYLTPPVDALEKNIIYINHAQLSEDIYTTMAHEGYPGHLYQNVYTSSKNLPLIRNLFFYSGYSEGWATYVEHYAYGLGGLDENLAQVLYLNSSAMLGIYAYIDMGIHYLGWDVQQVEKFLSTYGLGSKEVAQMIFETMVEEPVNYLSYFIGYLEILNLKETAQEAWGEEFTLKKFHEAVLTIGPAPFSLLEEAIMEWEFTE